MKKPIDSLLDSVEWQQEEPQAPSPDGIPHVTHHGVLNIGGFELRCYRLSDGQSVFNADDFEGFFGNLLS